MEKISIEYCHIYPGKDNKKEIEEANKWMPKIIGMFSNYEVQKCIMFDDIHATREINEEFIKSIVDQLEIKPDCIYCESEFIQEAHDTVKKINTKERDFIHSDEYVWLRENVKKFKTSTEFLLNWKNKEGKTEFSCPALAATSYLTRLGLIESDGVKTIYGEDLMVADHLLNVLPSFYVQVEDNARSIVEASFKDSLGKISWFFY
jgi:hypothetical protein